MSDKGFIKHHSTPEDYLAERDEDNLYDHYTLIATQGSVHCG